MNPISQADIPRLRAALSEITLEEAMTADLASLDVGSYGTLMGGLFHKDLAGAWLRDSRGLLIADHPRDIVKNELLDLLVHLSEDGRVPIIPLVTGGEAEETIIDTYGRAPKVSAALDEIMASGPGFVAIIGFPKDQTLFVSASDGRWDIASRRVRIASMSEIASPSVPAGVRQIVRPDQPIAPGLEPRLIGSLPVEEGF